MFPKQWPGRLERLLTRPTYDVVSTLALSGLIIVSPFRLKKVDAAVLALAYAGSGAEVESIEQDGRAWVVTLSGDLRLPKQGPTGVSSPGHRRCRGACISFDGSDAARTDPVSVVAWGWY